MQPFSKLLIIALTVFYISGCKAQPAKDSTAVNDTTVSRQPGKHHFKFTEKQMYYNGIPFQLGDSLEAYIKIFGKYNRKIAFDCYVWDSLGMIIVPAKEFQQRVSMITWQVSFPADYKRWDTAGTEFKNVPKCLIPEPLEIEKCRVLITPNMRFKKLLSSTDCFYESVLHGLYKTTGYTDSRPGAFQSIYYYADSEVYDMAENKTPYAVVREFSVSADD